MAMLAAAWAAGGGGSEALTPQERAASLQACFARYTVQRPPRAASVQEWERRKVQLRRQVLDCLGLWPLPKRVPLKLRLAAERPGQGYTLQRIYWQIFPAVYASGWLYKPVHLEGRVPAILCPHGHWENGARHPTVQTRCIVLAQKGYVVLAVDAVHLDDYRGGLNPVGLMTWINMRALDVLESCPEVDARRIGCTGASGGAQQTMYLMAVEPRLAAAVPTVMVSYFSRILALETAHCYCNHVPALLRFTDEPELCAAFAPKPALYMCVTGDWTAWFPHEGFPEIQAIYRLYQAADRVECRQWEGGHDYTQAMRETMYAFFDRWLKGQAHPPAPEPAVETVPPEELLALGPNRPTAQDLDKISADFLARRAVPPADWTTERPLQLAKRLRPALAELLGEPLGGPLPTQAQRRGEEQSGDGRLLRLSFPSEPGVIIPALVILPPPSQGPMEGVVLAAPEGKQQALTEFKDLLARLVRRGKAVLCLDHRLVGELAAKEEVWLVHGILWGRPLAAMAARDLRAAARILASMPGVASGGAALVAFGRLGVPALLAAALDGGEAIRELVCSELGPTYHSGQVSYPPGDTAELINRRSRPANLARLQPPVLPNVLKIGDLPEIAACVLPRRALLGGVGDPAPYQALCRAGLQVQADPLSLEAVGEWLLAASGPGRGQ
jgi:hypothetical protein